MISGRTKSGFEFSINENVLNDWRLAKAIAMTQAKDETDRISGAVKLVEVVLGDQEDALCAHVDKDGFVSSELLLKEVTEIMAIAKEKSAEVKN